MLSAYSSNAILAKARSMYGKRLTPEDYRSLLSCQNVGEVAGYLKNHTVYKNVLSGSTESGVHRGRLEQKLKQKLFDDYASLCRYEISVGAHFASFLISSGEIEQILRSVVLLNAGTPEEYMFSMPAYLNTHSRIDLTALGRIKDFKDLLGALAHTQYAALLSPFKPISGAMLDYGGMENALYKNLYADVYKSIALNMRGEAGRQLKEIFDSYIDLLNYVRIARLRFSYSASEDFARSMLLPFGSLSRRAQNSLLEAETEEELSAAMNRTRVGKRFLKLRHSYVDEIPMLAKYRICKHDIRFSTHPPVVMMSYVFLTQLEILDIFTIVEGIRYQLPPEEIKKLLTIAGENA